VTNIESWHVRLAISAEVLGSIGLLVALAGFLLPLITANVAITDTTNNVVIGGTTAIVLAGALLVLRDRLPRLATGSHRSLRAAGLAAVLVGLGAVVTFGMSFIILILNVIIGILLGIDGYGP
jgi:hypothetical protein